MNTPFEVTHGLTHLFHQEEIWFSPSHTGLLSLEHPDDQNLILPPPHFRVSQPTSRCEVLHEAQHMMGLQQHAYEGRQQMEEASLSTW
jgi:hypothetical protein